METLAIKATRFANEIVKDINHPDKILLRDLIALSYSRGAKDEREDMVRWRDPVEELPTENRRVIVRAVLPNRAELITGGWYGTKTGEQGWHADLDDTFSDLKVVGWRPIIEVGKL